MPRNGSGVYGLPAGTAAVPNTTIESAKYNSVNSDVAQALTDSVNVQGTAPFQANQPMGGNKLTGLGAGTVSGDSISLGQAQSGIVAHAATVAGTADAITAAFSPPFTAWTAKMRFRFTAGATNTVTNPTANVDGLGAKTIKKLNGAVLAIGDIAGNGHICECLYDGTDVILLNPALGFGGGQSVYTAKQTFSGPLVKGTTILADAATIAWDLSTGSNFKLTITSNRTLGAFTNGVPGQEGILTVTQDGTGGWSLNFSNAAYKFWGPSIENIARGANDETAYAYRVISPTLMILQRLGATTIGGSGRDLLAVQAANSSASIDFVLTKWLQLYDRFEVDFEDVLAGTDDAAFWLRTSTTGGSSYDAGGADYNYVWSRLVFSGGGLDSTAGTFAQIGIISGSGGNLSNVAGETAAGTVTIYNPRAVGRLKVKWTATNIASNISISPAQYNGLGTRETNADVDAIRFLCSAGNIVSGTFRLYGIRG